MFQVVRKAIRVNCFFGKNGSLTINSPNWNNMNSLIRGDMLSVVKNQYSFGCHSIGGFFFLN